LLKVSLEFRKGLLFIRLKGVLTKDTSNKLNASLEDLILRKGVKYFVINLEKLDYIDKDGIEVLKSNYNEMIMHEGKLVICGCKNRFLESMVDDEIKGAYRSNNELGAFNLINI